MKLAFMGSDPIALPLLDYLVKERPSGFEPTLIFTQPDRRTGRGMHVHVNPVKTWALEHGIEVLQPRKCGAEEADILRQRGIDRLLVMAYGQILPRVILESTGEPVLNVHASLLPRLRGASPIHTAVALGLPQTGVSLMQIIPQLDAGPVALQEIIDVHSTEDAAGVIEKLSRATVKLVERGLGDWKEGNLEFREQDAGSATYCRILVKTDRHLDFNRPAGDLVNRVRAFQPWPGTTFPHGDHEIRVHAAAIDSSSTGEAVAGTVDLADGVLRIACGKGWLVPEVLQRPGGKPLPTEAFMRGYPLEQGQVLESRPMQALEAAKPFPYRRK